MKKLILFTSLIIYTPLLLTAQRDINYNGIRFEQGLSWEQIKKKAKAQNKSIFVDCYATWCGPCKKMDKDVYPNERVGAIFNNQYISVKVQMDTAKTDNYNIQLLYTTARELHKQYKITGLPTYLFFSPEGKILHKEMGGKSVKELISLALDAANPEKQIYTLYGNCQAGKLNYRAMPDLAKKMKLLGEDSLSLEIAKKYMHDYLDKLSTDDLLKKENLEFIRSYARIVSSKDRIFNLYLRQPLKIDSITSIRDYSKSRVIAVINQEEIAPCLNKGEKKENPIDWKEIYNTIKNKYDKEFATDAVLSAKTNWYYEKKDWDNYMTSLMELWKVREEDFTKYGWMYLNHIAWTICVHSKNKEQLVTALTWVNMAISMLDEPNIAPMDTKAMILYKLGNKEEAIAIEREVIKLSETAFPDEEKQTAIAYYQNLVNKMIKGEAIVLVD